MTLGEYIKNYLRENNMTYRELAQRCDGVSHQYLYVLANGKNPSTGKRSIPSLEKVRSIARAMGVTLTDILRAVDDFQITLEEPTAKNLMEPPKNHIPLVGAIAAGEPIFDEFVDEFVDTNINADCALIVRGNSMLPLYHDGDIVYIRECPEIAYNGQIAAVIVEDEATLKRVYKGPQIRLKSENTDYKDIVIDPAEKSVRILGKVVAFTRILHED